MHTHIHTCRIHIIMHTHTCVGTTCSLNIILGSSNFNSTQSLLLIPEVVFLKEQVCIRCVLTSPSLNACVAIIHGTLILEQQLRVYSFNKSECFNVSDWEEFSIAVFGLHDNGLERTPVYKNSVRKYNVIETSGKCMHDVF